LKHGECFAADRYEKDLKGRYTNNEHQNHQKGHKKKYQESPGDPEYGARKH
jgi:hypothetical protein